MYVQLCWCYCSNKLAEHWGSSWFTEGLRFPPSGGLSKWKNGLTTETLKIPVMVSIKPSSGDGIAPCNNSAWHWLPRKQLCRNRARIPGLYECDIKFCTIRVMKANSILYCVGKGVASGSKKVILFTFFFLPLPFCLALEATPGALFPVQGSLVDERRDISKLSWVPWRVTKLIRKLLDLTLWVCSAWRREC